MDPSVKILKHVTINVHVQEGVGPGSGGSGMAINRPFTAGKVSTQLQVCLTVLQHSSTQFRWRGANGDFPQYKFLCFEG